MNDVRITVNLPCYGRPERTKRSIQCILDQDINGWEAFIMGDCCPEFQKLIDSGYLQSIKEEQEKKGNIIHFFNAEVNGGGCGYRLTNHAIQNATGKYFVFFANDDVIDPTHFRNYLEIENTDLDYMFFDSFIDPIGKSRESRLAPSVIGHSEIILKTELAKQLPEHSAKYGHDWEFINAMAKQGKGEKSKSTNLSYRVMHVPNLGTKDRIN
jgi:glycosyltransferase involved in cell wall biosynthesis